MHKNWKWAIVPLLVTSACAKADIGSTPVIGGVVNSTEIIKNQIVSTLSFSTKTTRDVALFTIAGVSLDVYILTLPLDKEVKARVIAQLSNPAYSIPLGYFLYMFYDRYTGFENKDIFKEYLTTIYDEATLKKYQHSLYQFGDDVAPKKEEQSADKQHHQGIEINNEFIASMVVVYDALVDIDDWRHQDKLPEQYSYLTNSPEDLAIVNAVQPIVMGVLESYVGSMEEGDMKWAIELILEDAKPENSNKVNNKAQALTVTLIDFVRLNVLKGYRQYVYREEYTDALSNWLTKALSDDPEQLIGFLESQQKKRYAVQVTVDGLQQGLLEGLVSPQPNAFLKTAYQTHQNRQQFKPSQEPSVSPEHVQQVDFLANIANAPVSDPHYLPFFKKLYQQHRDSITQVGISSTPTISVRNLPIIKTGAKVAGEHGTGIPNFHFVDRNEDRAYYFFGNDALQLDRLMNAHNVQTMFDRLSYLKTLNCNAQYDWNAHVTYDGLINLGLGEALRDYGEQRCLRELQQRAEVEVQLRQERAELIDDIRNYQDISSITFVTKSTRKWAIQDKLRQLAELDLKGMPDFTLVYNPWADHFAHFTGPFSDEILAPTGELNRLDYWLGQLEKTYQKAGVYEQTLWGMAGDHGLTPVFYALNPEKQVLESLQKELGYSLIIKKISSDEGEGPKITNALNYPSYRNVDVVVASTAGGNFMMDFFNSDKGWKVQPVYRELVNWQPINKPSDAPAVDVIAETAQRLAQTLDYLVVRESDCVNQTCTVRLVGTREGQRKDELIYRHGNKGQGTKLFYASVSGAEPVLLDIKKSNPYLGEPSDADYKEHANLVEQCLMRAKLEDVATWCDEQQWRALTRFTPRPDSIYQLAHLYDEDRAGTVNLFPKEGIGYNTKVPGRHAGDHYLEKDAFIGFWGAPIGNQAIPLTSEANGSLAPTLYEYLTEQAVVENENGWGFPSLLNKLDIQTIN